MKNIQELSIEQMLPLFDNSPERLRSCLEANLAEVDELITFINDQADD